MEPAEMTMTQNAPNMLVVKQKACQCIASAVRSHACHHGDAAPQSHDGAFVEHYDDEDVILL